MVLQDLIEQAIERGAALVGAHGFEAGLLATALLVLYHGHEVLGFLQRGLRTTRIGFVGAALVGLLLAVGLSLGWINVASLPSLPSLPSLGQLPFVIGSRVLEEVM